jgi:Flp pilus assembly protein TadG
MRHEGQRAGQGERGSVTVSFAFMLPVLCCFVVAALVLSREALERRELQSAADALALAGTHSLEQNGTPFHRAPADPLPPKNARLKVTSVFTVERRPLEHRALVRVDADTVFDSQQGWFPKRILPLKVTAWAQVNENVFGDKWPALLFAVDSSQSMNQPILGSSGTSAYTVITQLVQSYASNTLPVRNGVILFNRTVVAQSAPPPGNQNNLQGIQQAFVQAGTPRDLTDARGALDRARQHLTGMLGGRNVVFVSDGEPTAGPCGPDQAVCHFQEAVQASNLLRNLVVEGDGIHDGVALFTVEIRRSNYWSQVTDFLRAISGKPMSAGNDATMSFPAQSMIGIQQFITGLTRSICMFGPLDPKLGDPTPAASRDPVASPLRGRPGNPDLNNGRRRVFAFLREPVPSEIEHPLPIVPNRDFVPNQQGFEYFVVGQDAFVILTLASCNYLGADNGRRLIVRWDDPQLVLKP